MNIRLLKIDDYAAVHDLWSHTDGMSLNAFDDSRAGIENFLRRNPETCFVAEIAGEIVGVILAGNDGRRGYIYHTAVKAEFRRRGIASRLLEETLAALEHQGIRKAALVVFSDNELGNNFWDGANFSVRSDLIYRDKILNPWRNDHA